MAYNLYPAVDEVYNFPPEIRTALAKSQELRNTVVPMTTTIRNNLLPAELWDGRTIANTTTDHLERYDSGSAQWREIAEGLELDSIEKALVGPTGFRNVLRNGDFQISQRGNGGFSTSGQYTVDGLINTFNGAATLTRVGLSADDSISTGSISHRVNYQATGQSSAANFAKLQMPIESVTTLAGKQVTLSFTGIVSGVGGPYKVGVELEQAFGSGGSTYVSTPVGTLTVDSAAWRRYTLTFTVPSIAGKTMGTGASFLNVVLWISAGANNATFASSIGLQNWTLSMTDVQLEAGPVATPFERLPVEQQLAWCQRYFHRVGESIVGAPIANATLYSNVDHFAVIRIPPMRTTPSVSVSGATHFKAWFSNTSSATSSVYLSTSSSTAVEMVFTTGSSTPGISSFIRTAVANAYIDFSAEL